MNKLGKGAAFFIAMLVMLTNSYATRASSMESLAWLPLLSANIKKLQPDKKCPQNQLRNLQVNKRNGQIESKISALHWDLDCVQTQTASDPSLSEKEKQQVQLFIKQLSTLPNFKLSIHQIKLITRLFNRAFIASLSIQKTASTVTMTLKSDLLNVQASLLLDSKKLRVDASVDLSKIPNHIALTTHQARYLNGALVLRYESDLDHWQQGEFAVDWQGRVINASDSVSLSMLGTIDLLEERIILTTILVNAEKVEVTLSDQQSWKAGYIKLSNVNPAHFDYAQQQVEHLSLALRIGSSNLLTRVERGESKRIRTDQQKIPSILLQSTITGRTDKLQADWRLTLLNQALNGELLLARNIVALQIVKNSINIKLLLAGLSDYIEEAALVDIESGELLLDLNAEYNLHDQSTMVNGALVSTEIAGKKEDILFDGVQLNSEFNYLIDAQKRVIIKKDKQQLKIENLFVGVPIQALQVNARLQYFDPIVDHFKARLLGGRLDFDDFKINAPSQTTVHLSGISFAELIKYSAYPEIQGKGLIDGVLPLTLTDAGPEIAEGVISARDPGGYIKVPENTVIKAMGRANPAFSLTMQLLSNFQFDTMQGRIGYTSDGESDLRVEIKGISPTVSGTQPINFNYSHNENILKLLKSLRFNDELLRDIKERY